MKNLTTLILLGLFFGGTLIIGFFASKRKGGEQYIIAGRSLGLFQSIMTICGTFVGPIFLLVYTAFVFRFGISAIWIFIGYLLGFLLFTLFALYLRNYSKGKQLYTMTDYFRSKYGKTAASLVVFALIISYFALLACCFIGGGKVFSELTGMSFQSSAIIIFLIILPYLLMGGFQSVVKTDALQFIVLGLIFLVMIFTIKTGLQVPMSHFNLFNAPVSMIVAFLLLGLLNPLVWQDYWQRVYAMKDTKIVKKAFIISGFLLFLVALIFTYLGLVARSSYPTIDADLAVLYSFTKLAPDFMVGLIAVAVFAAVFSSADSIWFALAVNISNDVLKVKTDDDKKRVRYTRYAILFIGVITLSLSLSVPNIVNLAIILKAIGLALAPLVLFSWLTKGHKMAVIFSIIFSIIAIFISTVFGFIRPELAFVAIFTSVIVYLLTIMVCKILKVEKE